MKYIKKKDRTNDIKTEIQTEKNSGGKKDITQNKDNASKTKNGKKKERTHKETENESVTEEHTQRRTERETEIKTEGTQATSKERKHLRDTQREKDKWTTQTHAIKRNGKQPK